MSLFIYDPLSLKEVKEKPHPWAKSIKDVYSNRIKHAHNSIRNPIYPAKEEKQPQPGRMQFTVIGDRLTKEFIYCTNLVKGLYKYKWKNFDVPVIRGCSTVEWPEILHGLKLLFKGIAFCLQSSVAVLLHDQIIGGEKELQKLVETKFFYHLCLDYYNEGVAEFARFIRSTSLYADIVPYTCENFLRLCKETKGGYGGTPVHRIVKDGWIQCGGFGLKRTPLSCENFIIPFDRRGVLAMANDGRNDDCSTQFFVLLQPSPWMNQKYVAFGQLIEGAATLEKIEKVTTWYESPTSKIVFYQCGILNMDCHEIMINKGANEYIDGHIEDFNDLRKLLWEHILETVFLKAQLREIDRLREQHGQIADGSSDESVQKKFEKVADDLTLKETEHKVAGEEDDIKPFSISSDSLVVDPHRPYYIPLTDVPYPGDIESDFDLKRFLKGDYCLECDLDFNAYANDKTKRTQPSLLFTWSDSELTSPATSDEITLNSEEQEELENYLK